MTSPQGTFPSWIQEGRVRPRVLLLGSGERPHVLSEADRLRPFIEQHAEVVLTDFRFREDLASVCADLAIVFGGDGSILRAAKQMGTKQIPVLGVNLGRLGFLANVSPEEFLQCLPGVCAGNCTVLDHLMLRCSIVRGGQTTDSQLGLNEVAILGGPPYAMLSVELYVDSDLVTTYSCDGLIISTPVGSTAHSLSAGGPILRKNLQAFVISPISPHTLTMRPVVDTADRIYEIVVSQPHDTTTVVLDGVPLCRLTALDRVRVERAEPTFKMIEIPERHYYRTLREKLGWSGDVRSHAAK
ncbi:MAG: NAD(+)/NADH kinase [Candidatus Anammoximicrobium sp.]|nr:NAD(+)/NADH kinase [Candidatus Anammoximicrobium sp.]